MFNEIRRLLPPELKAKLGPRDEWTWNDKGDRIPLIMHTDNALPAKPPTIEERILGQEYLNVVQAIKGGLIHIRKCQIDDNREGQNEVSITKEELDELYHRAMEEIQEYNDLYGPKDSDCAIPAGYEIVTNPRTKKQARIPIQRTRKWRLGDQVTIVRHSADDLPYEEMKEEREQLEYPAASQFEDDLHHYGPVWIKLWEDEYPMEKMKKTFVPPNMEKGAYLYEAKISWFDKDRPQPPRTRAQVQTALAQEWARQRGYDAPSPLA